MTKPLTIAIDGPAGAGKSTIAKNLAKQFDIIYVDTGAMYRAVAFYMMSHKVPLADETAVVKAMSDIKIELKFIEGSQVVILNDQDVTTAIRRQEVGENASKVSAYLSVRQQLVEMQQAMAEKTSLVMDGRDIGTHVLIKATLKIYLSADVMVRAKRRYDELVSKGERADLANIAKEISDRDYRDMNREHAPLKQAEDAVLVDTSYMSINEVTNHIIQLVKERQ